MPSRDVEPARRPHRAGRDGDDGGRARGAEETGIEADIGGLVDIHDVILRRESGTLLAHYLIAVFYGRWRAGEPSAGSDASAARFVRIGESRAIR